MRKQKQIDHEPLLNAIPTGEQNAIHMHELAKRMNLSERELRKAVLEARRAGHVILSGTAGYWLPFADQIGTDAVRYIRQKRKQALSSFMAAKPVKDALQAAGFDVKALEKGRGAKHEPI